MADKETVLHFGGNKRLLPRSGSDFYPELKDLCTRAGLEGSVSLVVLHNFPDLQAKDGLHVHTPQQNGVPISWHNSDKEGLRVLLSGHNGLDKHELHKRLLGARSVPDEKDKKSMPKPPDIDAVLSKILGEEPSSQEAEPRETLVATEAKSEEVVAPTAEMETKPTWRAWTRTPSCTNKFFDNTDNTGLFLLEIAAQANQQGELSTKDCVAILRKEFGFFTVEHSDVKRRVEYNEPYGVLTRLVMQDLLMISRSSYRQLTTKAHELLGENEKGVEQLKPKEASPETPTMLVSTMLDKLTAFARRVEAAEAKRTRLCELDARRAEIAEQQRALQDELDRVVAEIEPLAVALQEPSVKADEAAYATVEMLFKE